MENMFQLQAVNKLQPKEKGFGGAGSRSLNRRSSNRQSSNRKSSNQRYSRRYPVKRRAVQKAHRMISQLLRKLCVPRVKKAYGSGIIRVCCRTIIQLDNIPLLLKELINNELIEAVGMPLKYDYKMKTLVLFIKPTNPDASLKLDQVFEKCVFGYHHLIIEVSWPTDAVQDVTDIEYDHVVATVQGIANPTAVNAGPQEKSSAAAAPQQVKQIATNTFWITIVLVLITIIAALLLSKIENAYSPFQ